MWWKHGEKSSQLQFKVRCGGDQFVSLSLYEHHKSIYLFHCAPPLRPQSLHEEMDKQNHHCLQSPYICRSSKLAKTCKSWANHVFSAVMLLQEIKENLFASEVVIAPERHFEEIEYEKKIKSSFNSLHLMGTKCFPSSRLSNVKFSFFLLIINCSKL